MRTALNVLTAAICLSCLPVAVFATIVVGLLATVPAKYSVPVLLCSIALCTL